MVEERDGQPVHDVHRAVALLTEGVEAGLAARTWSLSPAEVRAALADVCRLENQLTALRYSLIRASVLQDNSDTPGRETQQWLQATCRQSAGRARGDVENAALVDPETGTLAELGQALAQGEVSREHVDVARRAVTQLPAQVVRCHRREVAENLTGNARRFTAADARKLAGHLLAVLVPERTDRLDPHAHERRAGWCSWESTGMLRVNGLLAGEAAAAFKTVFDHLAAPGKGPDPDDPATPLPGTSDARTPAQRGADALELMGRLAASHPDAGTRAGEPPHVMVTATVDQLAWLPAAATESGMVPPGAATCAGLGPIDPALLQRLACDAVLQTVVLDSAGRVVEMRSPQRLANRALRRALGVRDGGCAFPGCSLPPSMCDAHHITYWTRGGKTVLVNLCLLCPRHHSEIHAEEWTITVIDELPWFIPPWIDPTQTPIRNTVHAAAAETTALAQLGAPPACGGLWLDIGPDG